MRKQTGKWNDVTDKLVTLKWMGSAVLVLTPAHFACIEPYMSYDSVELTLSDDFFYAKADYAIELGIIDESEREEWDRSQAKHLAEQHHQRHELDLKRLARLARRLEAEVTFPVE